MSPELEAKLVKAYPALFRQIDLPMSQTCMCWGVAVGDGWFDVVRQLCQKLTELNQGLQFTQIKEKFGTLRVYLESYSTEAEDIIAWAERMSEVTCEECGNPGRLNKRGWLSARCADCRHSQKEAV